MDTIVNLETNKLTYDTTRQLLAKNKDIVAIYLAGGGMDGAFQAVREMRNPGDVAMVVNELTPASRSALSDGYCKMVVSTPLRPFCAELMSMMRTQVLGPEGMDNGQNPGQLFMDPVLYLPESI